MDERLENRMRSNQSALKTASLAKMDQLKFLKLRHVELTGSYKNFPKLRWLYWSYCQLKEIPSGLLGSNLVAIDMSNGWLEKFEPPMVLNSLKILNLKWSLNLVSVCHLSRLPNLETLILSFCMSLSLTDVCETIGGLRKLSLLDFGWCNYHGKVALNNKYANPLQMLKTLCTGGGIPQPFLVPFPDSLKVLFLNDCNHDRSHDDDPLSLNHMNFGSNPLMFLTNYTNLKMLRVLDVSRCPNISYWPIGNTLDAGDEINVSIIVGDGFMVSRCGASLAFIYDGEEELEYYKNYKKEEEVIGGDLSEFELTTGAYYLCRRDYLEFTTPDWLDILLGDTIPHNDLHGWRKSLQTDYEGSYTEWKAYRDDLFSDLF
ncbi:unnamed protein product [Lactuca virosa]|uniref:Uncharacterized protein n=1 Tax=Lactuca virosa TaxID=75947 RepID=A0AAU9PGF9_9ASTR|nr:unnamed protein product [Lactuca virosa]